MPLGPVASCFLRLSSMPADQVYMPTDQVYSPGFTGQQLGEIGLETNFTSDSDLFIPSKRFFSTCGHSRKQAIRTPLVFHLASL